MDCFRQKNNDMDLNDLRVFCRVAERASFTRAAEELGLAKGRVSTLVQALEAELGGRLLQRTTRSVRLTPDGEAFLARCRALLTEADQLQGMFRPAAGALRGKVRIDMPGMFAQELVMPHLQSLLAEHPLLDLGISVNDRRIDMVREGFDALVRIGVLPDSDMVARPLGAMAMCNVASPAYLRRHGVPRTLADLAAHRIVHYDANLRSDGAAFRYQADGVVRAMPMRAALSVNSSTFMQAGCVNGLGIMQVALPTNRRLIDSGELVEVLPEFCAPPMQVSLMVPQRRHIAPRAQAVFKWLMQITRPAMLEHTLT
jgi:DNA-binding transcriptional LysR family regulator